MNFLAHCLLAQPGNGFIAGGVLGDFVKGTIPDSLPAPLRAGIRLHRRIDSCSNQLPAMKASVGRFPPTLRRVAPVLLDIVADHCLALAWSRYGSGNLPDFAARVYAALGRYQQCMGAPAKTFVDRMMETDLLTRYADPMVIRRAMLHVLQRLNLGHLGDELDVPLKDGLAGLRDDFDLYFPLLAAFARQERPRALEWSSQAAT